MVPELHDAGLSGLGGFAMLHRRNEANEGAIAAMLANGIRDEVILQLVFAGDLAPLGLKPVEDEMPFPPLAIT